MPATVWLVIGLLLCAAEVQRRMARRNADVSPARWIQFRIGINLGDVIVEDDGPADDFVFEVGVEEDTAARTVRKITSSISATAVSPTTSPVKRWSLPCASTWMPLALSISVSASARPRNSSCCAVRRATCSCPGRG